MAIETPCQTPGAQYHTHITDHQVTARVDLPFGVLLNKHEAERLEANIHNALELVLAPYFL